MPTTAQDGGVPRSRTVTKPVLLALANAVEEFALADSRDRPIAAVALFQRAPYFAAHQDVWARIAGTVGNGALIALAGEPPPELPAGLGCVPLTDREPLAGSGA